MRYATFWPRRAQVATVGDRNTTDTSAVDLFPKILRPGRQAVVRLRQIDETGASTVSK